MDYALHVNFSFGYGDFVHGSSRSQTWIVKVIGRRPKWLHDSIVVNPIDQCPKTIVKSLSRINPTNPNSSFLSTEEEIPASHKKALTWITFYFIDQKPCPVRAK